MQISRIAIRLVTGLLGCKISIFSEKGKSGPGVFSRYRESTENFEHFFCSIERIMQQFGFDRIYTHDRKTWSSQSLKFGDTSILILTKNRTIGEQQKKNEDKCAKQKKLIFSLPPIEQQKLTRFEKIIFMLYELDNKIKKIYFWGFSMTLFRMANIFLRYREQNFKFLFSFFYRKS